VSGEQLSILDARAPKRATIDQAATHPVSESPLRSRHGAIITEVYVWPDRPAGGL